MGGGFWSVTVTRVLDPDVDMTRRAVPIAPEYVYLSVFVLRCALAPAIRRAGTATPDRPECNFLCLYLTFLSTDGCRALGVARWAVFR